MEEDDLRKPLTSVSSAYPRRHLHMAAGGDSDAVHASGKFWRTIGECIDELELVVVAPPGARLTSAISAVVIFGLEKLDGALVRIKPADQAALLQIDQSSVDVTPGGPAGGRHDFGERWRDAMRQEMGADEVKKFELALRDRPHLMALLARPRSS